MQKIKDIIRRWIYRFIDEPNNPIIKRIDDLRVQMLDAQKKMEQVILNSNKYGLICNNFLQKYYTEKTGKNLSDHFVSYYYESSAGFANLGDYIQTIATEKAIRRCVQKDGRNPIFENVLRSNLTEHQGGTCVMQGWFEHKQLTFLPGRNTRPIWIGTHFSHDAREMIKQLYATSEIRFTDIGCRDKSTMAFCQSLGMVSYFSRCLTLTFPRRSEVDASKATNVYIVDCPDIVLKHLPDKIKDGAIIMTQRNYRHAPWQDWKKNKEMAAQLLEEYHTKAKLIITTALHCAQPCIAMGIPTVFINPEYDEADRFSSMDGLIRQYSIEDIINGEIEYPTEAPFYEDLKDAILRNLELSLKVHLTEKEEFERQNIREFIGNYNIIETHRIPPTNNL